MVLVMVDGEKTAIPMDAPPVYEFLDTETIGGNQVVSNLLKNVKSPEASLTFLMAHQADG